MGPRAKLQGRARTYRCPGCGSQGIRPGEKCMIPRCNWRAPSEPAYVLEAQFKRNTKDDPFINVHGDDDDDF